MQKAMNSHNIKILNSTDLEKFTYPIIKVIGSVQYINSLACQNNRNTKVHLYQNGLNVPLSTDVINEKFKFLIELQNGKNQINIQFCCETVNLNWDYFPAVSENAVIPLYVICEDHDGCFQAPPWENNTVDSACKRITLGCKLLQCVTAEKLYEHGLGRKTFFIENECQVFRSQMRCEEVMKMSQMELWGNVGREIMRSPIGSENKKYLAFLSCTKYHGEKYNECLTSSHEELIQLTDGYVALGGGGLALFGSACLYTWSEKFEDVISRFENNTPVDRKQFLDDSCYRGTLGACFSTTLGSVLHELFHTFDLGHNKEGIMGRGFDNIYKVFTNFHNVKETIETCSETQKTFQDKIEFKEEFEAESLLERIKNENKKKEFTVIKKFEEIDDTVLSRSCAVILCYHKWFNQNISKQSSILSFDSSNNLIKSTAGIRVVELRSCNKELVLHSWIFDGRVLKFSFQIPHDSLIEMEAGDFIIFVEDTLGCILKESIHL